MPFINPKDPLIDGNAASEFLTECGVPLKEPTLTRMRSVGGGPRFFKIGGRVYYRRSAILKWLAARAREREHT